MPGGIRVIPTINDRLWTISVTKEWGMPRRFAGHHHVMSDSLKSSALIGCNTNFHPLTSAWNTSYVRFDRLFYPMSFVHLYRFVKRHYAVWSKASGRLRYWEAAKVCIVAVSAWCEGIEGWIRQWTCGCGDNFVFFDHHRPWCQREWHAV